MKNFWTYISTLFAGIIAGMMIYLKLDGPDTVINDNQRIGKIKQRGTGNDTDINKNPALEIPLSGKEIRQARRAARRAERQERREKRRAEST